MNSFIVSWIKKICKKQGLSSFYLPHTDTYMLHFRGRALQGFNSNVFFQLPPLYREKQLVGILKSGLRLNIDLKNRNNLYTKKRLGKTIVE